MSQISQFSQYGINNYNSMGRVNFQGNNINSAETDQAQSQLNESGLSVSFSSQGKAMSLVESLNKQKTELTDNKNELIADTLANGESLESIESQLEMYDEKLTLLDEQINEVIEEEREKETEEKELKTYSKEPQTKEESLSAKLTNLVNMTGDLKQAESTQAIQKDIDSEIRILEGQAKGEHGVVREKKLEEIAELKNISEDMAKDVNAKLADVTNVDEVVEDEVI